MGRAERTFGLIKTMDVKRLLGLAIVVTICGWFVGADAKAQDVFLEYPGVSVYKPDNWCRKKKDAYLVAVTSNQFKILGSSDFKSAILNTLEKTCRKADGAMIDIISDEELVGRVIAFPPDTDRRVDRSSRGVESVTSYDILRYGLDWPENPYVVEIEDSHCRASRLQTTSKIRMWSRNDETLRPSTVAYSQAYKASQSLNGAVRKYKYEMKKANGKKQNRKQKERDAKSRAEYDAHLEEFRVRLSALSDSIAKSAANGPDGISGLYYLSNLNTWTELAHKCFSKEVGLYGVKAETLSAEYGIADVLGQFGYSAKAVALPVLDAWVHDTASVFYREMADLSFDELQPNIKELRIFAGDGIYLNSPISRLDGRAYSEDLDKTNRMYNQQQYYLGFYRVRKAQWSGQEGPFLSEAQKSKVEALIASHKAVSNRAASLSPQSCTTTRHSVRLRSLGYSPLKVGENKHCVPMMNVGLAKIKSENKSVQIDRDRLEVTCSIQLLEAFCSCMARSADGHFSKVEYDAFIDDPLVFSRYVSELASYNGEDVAQGFIEGLAMLSEGDLSGIVKPGEALALATFNHAEALANECRGPITETIIMDGTP